MPFRLHESIKLIKGNASRSLNVGAASVNLRAEERLLYRLNIVYCTDKLHS